MSDQHDRPTRPPDLPITSSSDVAPMRKSRKPGLGWKIATGLFALTTVGAVAWGITQTDSLQGQVDALQATVAQQEETGQAASKVAKSTADALEEQVVSLAKALDVLEKQAGDALDGAANEYARVEKNLKKTKRAVRALDKELSSANTDAAAIASAYEKAQAELTATQAAMAELLTALADETENTTGF